AIGGKAAADLTERMAPDDVVSTIDDEIGVVIPGNRIREMEREVTRIGSEATRAIGIEVAIARDPAGIANVVGCRERPTASGVDKIVQVDGNAVAAPDRSADSTGCPLIDLLTLPAMMPSLLMSLAEPPESESVVSAEPEMSHFTGRPAERPTVVPASLMAKTLLKDRPSVASCVAAVPELSHRTGI